jgi:hypothetical protein
MYPKLAPLIRPLVALVLVPLASCGGGSYGGGGGGGNPPATLNISVDPDTITLGESATITWNSNAPSCQASGDWDGEKSGDGTETVTPATAGEFTYTMVCSGGGYRDSQRGSATLTVNATAVAGAFVAEACCEDGKSFEILGLASETGDLRILAPGAQIVQVADQSPLAFLSCGDCLAGARLQKAPSYQLLQVTRLPSGRKADLDVLQGSYTTFLGNGYTLTLTVDAQGAIAGTDTRGCGLQGRVSRSRAANLFRIDHAVTGCGVRDGRYVGEASLLFNEAGQPAGLLMSTSNADSAIGWRLVR